MSSSGTALAPLTQKTITIQDGNVAPGDEIVYVKPRAIVKFTNNDPLDYAILLFVREGGLGALFGIHADVDLFLPAFGTVTTVAGIGLKNGLCVYRIIRVPADSLGEFDPASIVDRLRRIEGGDLIVQEQFFFKAPAEGTFQANAYSKSGGGAGGGGTIHIGS